MDETNGTQVIVSNAFLATLMEIRTGRGLIEAGDQLTKLVAAVRDTGKGGKLTFQMTIEPGDNGPESHLIVRDKITVTLPERPRPSTVFYATDENTLQRADPRQRVLDFKTVPAAPPVRPIPLSQPTPAVTPNAVTPAEN